LAAHSATFSLTQKSTIPVLSVRKRHNTYTILYHGRA